MYFPFFFFFMDSYRAQVEQVILHVTAVIKLHFLRRARPAARRGAQRGAQYPTRGRVKT
jgi:hypothetical protein